MANSFAKERRGNEHLHRLRDPGRNAADESGATTALDWIAGMEPWRRMDPASAASVYR